MSNKLLALKLILDAMGVGTGIDDVDARKEKQKAIYLAKILGVDLGYSYGWYVRGPYSPSLANDYYELQSSQEDFTGHTLKKDIQTKMDNFQTNLLQSEHRPKNMENHDWLELLASWHYLKHVSRYDDERAQTTFEQKKAHLADHTANAKRALEHVL